MLLKDKKTDTGKLAKKDKDPVKSGGKAKKWSKGKVRDKLNNLVLFDKATYNKLCKKFPTISSLPQLAVVSETEDSRVPGQGSPSGAPE